MAKKIKTSQNNQETHIDSNYEPQALLNEEGSQTDLQIAQKQARIDASTPLGGTSFRTNIMYRGQDLDRYGALQNMVLSAKEAIRFSQVVYYRYGMVRNALDTMAEFTIKDLIFHSDKKISQKVIAGWADGVDLQTFLEQVALEYYRSGNVYIYRFENTLKKAPFGIANADLNPNANIKIPVRYTMLDPNVIDAGGRSITGSPSYKLIIPRAEVDETLRHFGTDPRAIGELPKEFQVAIKNFLGDGKRTGDLMIDLDPNNLIVMHRKKQPYERYATPFLAGVFEDIEFRQEMRNMDKAVSRVVSRILIHVKVGNDKFIPSPSALNAIQAKLGNPSTSTYLITDGTVEINQYFPDIGAMLDPKKYEPVTLDIMTALGVSPTVYGGASASYSSNFLSIKVLVERIQDGKNRILRQFLIPEVLRVAKAFNLKNPTEIEPEIVGVDLTNEIEMNKLYSRLYEVGVLSPKSVLNAFKGDVLPTYEEEIENQQEALDLRSQGLFQPVLNRGGGSPDAGRPTGAPNPQQTKPINTTPKGGSSKATFLRAFTPEEFKDAKIQATKYIQSKLKLETLDPQQAQTIEDACAEFLITNPYSKKELKKFLGTIFGK